MTQEAKKYICSFAHFDCDNLIDDYVLHYLKGLKEISPEIVFSSDCNLAETEIQKLSGLTIHNIYQQHGEYDFGSHKRSLQFLKDVLKNCDYLILANDSCYGPLKPLPEIFEKMAQKNLDFWGMTTNKESYAAHIQSYFLVFSKKVFLSEEFTNFYASIAQQKIKTDVVEKYEVGLTQLLTKSGFKGGAFIEEVFETTPVMLWDVTCGLLKRGFPFIKVMATKTNPNPEVLKEKFFGLLPKKILFSETRSLIKFPDINWRRFASEEQIRLIENHLDRVGSEDELRIKIVSDKLLFFLIKKGVFRIKFLGVTLVKKKLNKFTKK